MATLREIKRRITSIKSTQQITKAMKMVSAAKLRKAQERIVAARPYYKSLSGIVNDLMFQLKDYSNPLFEKREVVRLGIVTVTADRGLCGSFNTNIIKKTIEVIQNHPEAEIELIPVGRKSWEFFKKRDYHIKSSRQNIFQRLDFSVVPGLVKEMTESFLNKEIDQWILIYNEFKSPVQQNIIAETFLPLELTAEESESVEYIFEPSKEEILTYLIPRFLETKIWKMLLESNAAEHGARMTAMENATENAAEMIATLTLSYNRARQAAITTEIAEIVGGAEALKG
ncbi:MAG: ATP synthase F1 subunit gamma [Calditrichia bacterium]